jgi:hypothetical protein
LCAGDFTNDTQVLKKSVLNNDGQLELRFPPRNFTTKKPDSGLNNNTSQEYTKVKRAESILKVTTIPVDCCPNPLFKTYNNYQQKSRRYPTHITKAANTAVDSSEYTQNIYSSLCACKEKEKMSQKRTSNMPPFGATVQTQPKDNTIACHYDKINRNFYLSSVKLLHDCHSIQ